MGIILVKKYDGSTLVDNSRFINYIDKLDSSDKKYLYDRVDYYIKDNPDLCDSGNHKHLSNIFTSMALYEFLKQNKNEEEAFEIVADTMYEYMQKQRRLFQLLSKYDFSWPILKKIVPIGFKYGSGNGWKYTWYKEENKDIFRFDCNECIYKTVFEKYDLKEFGPMFCKNDIIVYGELNNIDFKRTGTLCQGFDKCDFCFVKYQKGQNFERSKSQ